MKTAFLLSTLLMLQCASTSKESDKSLSSEKSSEEAVVQELFAGTIVYTATASGEKESAKLFNDSQATEVTVTWSEKGFQQIENTGWNVGKVIYPYGDKNAIFCNQSEKKIEKAAIEDFAKIDPEVKKMMPQLFTYEIKALDEFETIAGYKCQKHKVLKSGFMKAGATVHVWISKDLKLPASQMKFETEWKIILAAMPLQYGFSEGAVLKAVTEESSFTGAGQVTVTYQVSEVKKGFYPQDFLKKPEGYTEE